MKNNYYSINYTISPQENLKNIVNHNFQNEISLDVLRSNPPNYSSLQINNIEFRFYNFISKDGSKTSKHQSETSNQIEYIELSAYFHKGRKARYFGFTEAHKKKSLKIRDGKINLNYLRKNFENLKALRENDAVNYQNDENIMKEGANTLEEIKTKYTIIYPEINLNIQDFYNKLFQLSFNKITEDQIRMLMSYWQQMKSVA